MRVGHNELVLSVEATSEKYLTCCRTNIRILQAVIKTLEKGIRCPWWAVSPAITVYYMAVIMPHTPLQWTCLESYASLQHIHYLLVVFFCLSFTPHALPLSISFSFLPFSLTLWPDLSSLCFLSQIILSFFFFFISLLPCPSFLQPPLSLSLPVCFSEALLCPSALHYLVIVQWPLLSTRRHSGISVISISVTCLSIF